MSDFTKVVIGVFGSAITALLTWLTKVITNYFNSKIKDKKVAEYNSNITIIVSNAVRTVFQTYVDTLKKEGKFDENAQILAKREAMSIIKSQLTSELANYIKTNFGDVEEYLKNKIEATIYVLKGK